jgi:hypothetical protein
MCEMPASQAATGRASSQLHQGTLYLRTLFRGSWGAEHGVGRKPEDIWTFLSVELKHGMHLAMFDIAIDSKLVVSG